jgi:hypothetical protein
VSISQSIDQFPPFTQVNVLLPAFGVQIPLPVALTDVPNAIGAQFVEVENELVDLHCSTLSGLIGIGLPLR